MSGSIPLVSKISKTFERKVLTNEEKYGII